MASSASAAQDPWAMYAAERADIYAFLASLSPLQWDAPSLCDQWRVRDVAVHLIVDGPVAELGVPRALAKAASLHFDVTRINDWWVARNRERPVERILEAFDGPWRPGPVSRLMARTGGPDLPMRGVVIHHQDMRRPLGLHRVIPDERLRAALEVVLTPKGSSNLDADERARGLALRPTDLDWSWGEGAVVSGPAEAILMAIAGRPIALADLSGPGLDLLAARVLGSSPPD
jgi:uncharacterized protein (TIGR03083 family)